VVGFAIYSPVALLTNVRHSDQIKPLVQCIQNFLYVCSSGFFRRTSGAFLIFQNNFILSLLTPWIERQRTFARSTMENEDLSGPVTR